VVRTNIVRTKVVWTIVVRRNFVRTNVVRINVVRTNVVRRNVVRTKVAEPAKPHLCNGKVETAGSKSRSQMQWHKQLQTYDYPSSRLTSEAGS
jgi:hypothetical protein